jgi:hypothetical protein
LSRLLRMYLALLLLTVLSWLYLRAPAIAEFALGANFAGLLGIAALYLCSHLFRMLRLALLTLDERQRAFHLVAAHALTAFPSSFLPFKIGEILRLTAFFLVYEGRRKALAVWLAERFGDVLVITAFILGLSFLNVGVPPAMRVVLVLFVLVTVGGLLSLFAVAKVFVYLNRHLVLASHSDRGLKLLRASHALRQLELDTYRSVSGRLSGFVLLSILIWAIEILALSLYIRQLSIGEPDFAGLFAFGLLANLPGGGASGANGFGLYQSLTLVALSFIFSAAWWIAARPKTSSS